MNDPLTYDFAVIGAGIAGASVGWRLALQGCAAVVLEREAQPGYHSTGRSAAMFMETYGTPQIRALTRASRAFYEKPPAGFAEVPLLGERGVLYVAKPGQEDLLRATYEELRAASPNVHLIDADAALARVPCLRPDRLAGAILEEGARDIDVNALHQGFIRGLRGCGGVLRTNAEVTRAHHDGTAWTLELADGSLLRAGAVIDAAGAWADRVAALCGAREVGLEPRRRSAFTFESPPGVDVSGWPAVVGVDEGYYFKPDAGQLLGSPANADPVEPHDVVAEELDVATGIHRIEEATTVAIRRPGHTWAGLRSFVADGDLVIGWDEMAAPFFWLAAQGGYGIQTAAAVSELAAALALRRNVPPELLRHGVDPAALSPRRFNGDQARRAPRDSAAAVRSG
jgi:D-arginine dehydrogenase